jgi:uncharacterized membrane-anchored protein
MDRVAAMPQPNSVTQQAVSTVPVVTAAFWVTKVLTSGMDETASDFLFHNLAPPIVLATGGSVLSLPWCFSSGHAGTCRGSTGSPSPW